MRAIAARRVMLSVGQFSQCHSKMPTPAARFTRQDRLITTDIRQTAY